MKTSIHKPQFKTFLLLGILSFLSTAALATIEIAERTAPGSIVQCEGHVNVWLQKRVSSSSVTSNFFFPGGASKSKLIERPELVNVWKTVKDIDGIDMADLLKNKFPDPSTSAGFYDAFKEQFLQPSSNGLENVFEVADVNKVETFLKDIGGPDNSLMDAFVGQPGLMRAWDDLSGFPSTVRRSIPNLTQRNILNNWADNIINATNQQKGNFGEIGADLDLNIKGYESLQPRIDDINSPGHNGIDGVYIKDGQYYIVEGKYSGSANLNPANPSTGLPKQMTDEWISQNNWQRLNEAVGENISIDIQINGYRRILAKTVI